MKQDDVVRCHKRATGLMPGNAITDQNGYSAGGHLPADLSQMQVRHFSVGSRRDHHSTHTTLPADGTETIDRIMPIIAHYQRP
jgi:hypothetical protein